VRSGYRISAVLSLAAGIASPVTPSAPRCALEPEHAAILVMQSPVVAKAKAAGGCPAADYQEKAPGLAAFQVRNLCPKSGDAALGTYLVDLNNGQVWDDAEGKHRLDTPGLRATRHQACLMSVRGIVPSLLPQGHPSRAAVSRVSNGATRRKPAARAATRGKT
jgi:hypothetical protein